MDLLPSAKGLCTLANQVLSILNQISEEELRVINVNCATDINKIKIGAKNLLDDVEKFITKIPELETTQDPIGLVEILKTIRHDLRTPVSAIKGYSELCTDVLIDKDLPVALMIRPIPSIADEMLKLINNLKEDQPTTKETIQSALIQPINRNLQNTGGKILIVDDIESNRSILEEWLKRKGYEIYLAKNGPEALAFLDDHPHIDIVLLDVMMPDMDGYDVLKNIKGDERFTNLMVIMISAIDEIDSVVQCIKYGAIDYLIKPFNPYLLDARITACLKNKKLVTLYQEHFITNQKLAALRSITSGIAHEIKNPMNFVINFSLLSLKLINDLIFNKQTKLDETLETLKENIEIILKESQQIDEIVQRMSDLSQSLGEKFYPVDINNLVSMAFNVVYEEYTNKNKGFNIEFKADLDANLKEIIIIPEELFFVLTNIFNNAFYALRQKEKLSKEFNPQIIVSTKKTSTGKIEIMIADNGIGISDENKTKIFTPFFSTKEPGEGIGLGLSLSHNIITQLHKGSLTFTSKPNELTKFLIEIPISNT